MSFTHTSSSFTASQKRVKGIGPINASLKSNVEAVLQQPMNPLPSTGIPAIDRLREMVVETGGTVRNISRVLFLMDDNGSRRLTPEEFSGGLLAAGIQIDPMDVQEISEMFGHPCDGCISVPDVVRALRGTMPERRWKLVNEVYDLLDTNRDHRVTFDVLKSTYDAHNHPLVLAKVKTSQQVMADFIRHWDKNGNSLIRRDEFVEYYEDLSAGIRDDQYFQLLVCNTWHIRGTEASALTSSCSRALVIHTNGTQTIEPILNSDGLQTKDSAKALDRLRRQGIVTAKAVFIM